LATVGAALSALLAGAGCDDARNAGPIRYAVSEKLQTSLAAKPELRARVLATLDELYGASPREMHIPPDAPLRDGGRLLASSVIDLSNAPEGSPRPAPTPILVGDGRGGSSRQAGGYALFRKHCLHCHGQDGDGRGPTSTFLWPRPRDFRPGLFKFTSTTGDKPTRTDLVRTIVHGLPTTSMPAFEALLDPHEVEQVADYIVFLSLRGQTEQRLVEEATFDESLFDDPDAARDLVAEITGQLFAQWKPVDQGGDVSVIEPEVARVEPTQASVVRGRDLFLGQTPEKLQCAGCHGPRAEGNGPSFVPLEVFNAVVFRGQSIESFDEPTRKLWQEGSLDAWGQPLRPATLNAGSRTDYKGGRRPIDLYWRIAHGIGGAKMPAHLTTLRSDQIWDLVNFVLALPYQPSLLDEPAGRGLGAGTPSPSTAEAPGSRRATSPQSAAGGG
jgi:mono/diheme cytochrome c family protein